MSPQATPWVLLPAQTDAQKLAYFTTELEGALQSLDDATAQSVKTRGDMKELAAQLQNRGWWDAVKANFDGQTDKTLATNVQLLGRSIETTQKVIRVILQVQTQKGRLLHTFSDALVDKISRIQTDAHTLDGNHRSVALVFLGELHQQIQEQIRHQELIDQHELKLQELAQCQKQRGWHDAEVAQMLHRLENHVTVLNQSVGGFEQWRQGSHSDQMLLLEQQVKTLQERLTELESKQANDGALKTALLRYGLSILALGVALVGVVKSIG